MANETAPVKGAKGAETKGADVAQSVNRKPALPVPAFKMVANPRTFQDKSDASKSSVRIAHVPLRFGLISFEASIYLETKVEQRADGRHELKALRFSMPKGVDFSDDVDSNHVAAWKDTVLDSFIAWREGTGESIAQIRSQPGVRALPASLSGMAPAAPVAPTTAS